MASQPDADAVHVDPDTLQRFVHRAAVAVDIPDDDAALLARLLIECDLRGVLSHGSRQIVRYVREVQSGNLNPVPRAQIIRETENSILIDGDGGLGYFPLRRATLDVIEKANRVGMAAGVCRNHGHIGAAGIYTRLTVQHDLIAFVTSGAQLRLKPGDPALTAAGGSPMSFSAPGHDGPPLILDAGVTHGLQNNPANVRDIARRAPGVVLHALGFGTICQAWGGLLTGLPADHARAAHPYPAANQGAMVFALRISLFADPAVFKREIDDYARQTRQLTPIDDTEGSYLPGHIEVQREQTYRHSGIPLAPDHLQELRTLGQDLGIATTF